ncbi:MULTISPECIES: Na/Pi symporter [unclassified Pseudodesulfovibrio]|uniref:Na/Pi cotransporter family protein n=1 Tax=unclassified Pseudodesulfovibrio TaxID=2661612 RepID=UPI000FEB94F2|nr:MULTISPECIES: Na/Pi symporter [unclassified Pseudodesulfovibrio]MCJ2163999.1 Na/Pi symporter [Pseudodesulfovibrio sp. S3-i]RWU05362.1 Na/Pi cotransporter family protein [Pseudodesulfovibrio sp. S3]
MFFSTLTGLFGGLGLFLLGMRLMTKGLRSAAGNALRNILGKWTKTPLRGLFSGFMVTALVQSSSAITVAVIGFVNAGLMTMPQSVGVIFGSNIGTTVTSWIVAAVGISVNVKALALPLIGLGALLRLTGADTRRIHFGDALTGFGLFFLGIEILQTTFQDFGNVVDLSAFNIGGVTGILLFVAIGATLTLLMQSSSAAMALVLTAAMSGIVTLESAAAATIGTNIGTTSTALFSVLGATYNAKKVAAAHIIFNLVTGMIAIMFIPLLLKGVHTLASLSPNYDLATALALFHTAFNLLGVAIFLPFTSRLVAFLDRHIGREVTELGKPRYLDDNVLSAPSLAIDALFMELGRLGEMTRETCQKALTSKFRHKDFIKDRTAIDTLIIAIRSFCVKVQQLDLPAPVAIKMPAVLRVIQYFQKTLNVITEVSQQYAFIDHQLPGVAAVSARAFRREVKDILNIAHTPCSPEFVDIGKSMHQLEDQYHDLKDELLRTGAQGSLELDRMVALLEYYSHMRLMCEQAVKGTTYWSLLRDINLTCVNADPKNEYAWKREA